MSAVLREYFPASWFHPVGILKVLKRLEPRLPDVAGKLHLTFTVDPARFGGPSEGFDAARNRLRRLFYRLRKGVRWEGKSYRIDAPYCVKLEFHESGWPHFHAIFLTRRFLPKELLDALWGFGFTFVQRIDAKTFRYLLKYVSKEGSAPDWILARERVRVFQASRGFLLPEPEKGKDTGFDRLRVKRKRGPLGTLGERLDRWERTALLDRESCKETIRLHLRYREVFDQVVIEVARQGRYLGNRRITINDRREVSLWQMATSPKDLTSSLICPQGS